MTLKIEENQEVISKLKEELASAKVDDGKNLMESEITSAQKLYDELKDQYSFEKAYLTEKLKDTSELVLSTKRDLKDLRRLERKSKGGNDAAMEEKNKNGGGWFGWGESKEESESESESDLDDHEPEAMVGDEAMEKLFATIKR